ncbi:MAG TPA: PAS domain S-box protein, partial [Allosphingosinicella sp.]
MTRVPTDAASPQPSSDFLSGSDEIGALMRARDWSDSPLGPPDRWPQMLKSTVSLMLPAAAQIVLFWGPEFVALYNDNYAPTIGDKHPRALGRPARENWAELWDDLEPLLLRVRDSGETVFAEDRPFYIERHGKPETVYFDISYSPVRDEAGAVAGVLCLVKETTQKVLSEQRVRTSETRLRNMADNLPVMVWVTDRDGQCVYLNRHWYAYTGQSEAEALGAGWLDAIHPDDRDSAGEIFFAANAKHEPFRLEYRLRRTDGAYRWAIDSGAPRFGANGEFAGFVGSVIDIEERRVAEDALRESEARFRAMADSAPAPVWVTGPEGIEFVNQAFCDFAGLPPEQLMGPAWTTIIHPDDLPAAARTREAAWETGSPYGFEARFRDGAGDWRWMMVSSRPRRDPAGTLLGYTGMAVDLTEMREAVDALRSSEDRLRLATEAASVGVWDFYPPQGILRWDARTRAAFGLSIDAHVDYDVFLKGLHPDDRGPTDDAVRRALDPSGPGGYDVEYRAIGIEDRVERWISARGRAVFESGEAVRFIGTVIDISDRKAAEAALARSEAELREQTRNLETLNSVATNLAGELDLEKVVQMVTDAGVAMSGAQFGAFFYNVLNAAGESYMLYTISGVDRSEFDKFPMPRNTAVFHPTFSGEGPVRSDDITKDPRYGKSEPHYGMPEGHLPVRSYLAAPVTSRTGEVVGGLFFGHAKPGVFTERHERLLVGMAGQAAVAIDNARLFESAQREIVERRRAQEALADLNASLEQRVMAGIAERERMEEALRQSQKMEAVGQLTGGIAHDFNNLLTVITGNLELAQRQLAGSGNARLERNIANALTGSERAAVLTQRLLAFSRRQPLAPKPIDPNKLVTGMSDLLHRSLGETISVETVLGAGAWRLELD